VASWGSVASSTSRSLQQRPRAGHGLEKSHGSRDQHRARHARAGPLPRWRGVNKVTVRTLDGKGQVVVRQKFVACAHKNHAYWAHYNHGPMYIDHGPARHYPHRIGVLYYALARTLGVDTTEVTTTRLTVMIPADARAPSTIPSKRATRSSVRPSVIPSRRVRARPQPRSTKSLESA